MHKIIKHIFKNFLTIMLQCLHCCIVPRLLLWAFTPNSFKCGNGVFGYLLVSETGSEHRLAWMYLPLSSTSECWGYSQTPLLLVFEEPKFNLGGRVRWVSASLRPAWSTQWDPVSNNTNRTKAKNKQQQQTPLSLSYLVDCKHQLHYLCKIYSPYRVS